MTVNDKKNICEKQNYYEVEHHLIQVITTK